MDLYGRRFAYAYHPVVVEVLLLYFSIFHGDLAIQRCRESINNTAFYLCTYTVRIYGQTGVYGAYHAVHTQLALVYGDFHGLRHRAIHGAVHCNTAVVPRGQWLGPLRFFGSEV